MFEQNKKQVELSYKQQFADFIKRNDMTNEELMKELQKELFAQVGGWVQFRRDFVVQLINALKVDEPEAIYPETLYTSQDIEKGIIAYEILMKLKEIGSDCHPIEYGDLRGVIQANKDRG